MSKKRHKVFGDIDDAKQKMYEREVRLQYDPDLVNESVTRWNSYSVDEQEAIKAEGNQIYADLADLLRAGKAPDSSAVQAVLERWYQHIHYFYEPSLDILRGLGEMYNTSPEFMANFEKLHPDLPAYLQSAVEQYVDDLETALLEQMLAEEEEDDDDLNQRMNRLSY
ncbi:MAG: TipAS antibiotic-recognition domain-containing protein [Anaerolineae bacterium]